MSAEQDKQKLENQYTAMLVAISLVRQHAAPMSSDTPLRENLLQIADELEKANRVLGNLLKIINVLFAASSGVTENPAQADNKENLQ